MSAAGSIMAAEMAEQPDVLARFSARFSAEAARVAAVVPRPLAGVVFAARGSSDHAAVHGRYLAQLTSGRPAGLAAPSLHTRYDARTDYSGHLVVALSQSGATPEIVTLCERVRAGGARCVAIVNDVASPLGTAADVAIGLGAGPELAVPATKTVTAQLLAVTAVAAALGPLPFGRERTKRSPRCRPPSPRRSPIPRPPSCSPPAGATPSGWS